MKRGEINRTIQGFLTLIHPDDIQRLEDSIERHRTSTTPIFEIYRVRKKDGSWIWWEDCGTPLLNEENQPIKWVGSCTDITVRKIAEDRLSEEQRFTELVVQSMPGLFYIFEKESAKFLRRNNNWRRLTGYSDGELETMTALDFFEEGKERDECAVCMQEVYDSGIASMENNLLTKSGKKIPFYFTWNRIDIKNNVYLLGMGIDVSERNWAVEKASRYSRVIENSLNEIYIFDADSLHFIEVNHGARENLGYSMEELYDLTALDLNPEITKDAFEKLVAPLRSGKREMVQFMTVHRRKDGSLYPVEVYLQLMAIDTLVFIAIVLDITERKRKEEERERLMLAIDQAAEIIVITGADGIIQYVNPAFERITGYTREEVIGRSPRLLKSGKHDQNFYSNMWDTLTRGETWRGRLINKKKDGSLYTEEAVISPVRDASGKIVCFVAAMRDVTSEIRLEDQLRHALKMEAVGQLAGGVAHDFNNLLTVILGHGNLALLSLEKDHSAAASLEQIIKAGDLAATLTRQLLAFSRRQVLEMVDLNLNVVINDLMKMIRRVLGEHITLDVITGHNLGTVRADRGQMEQILMNLCVNARDAMLKGGKITIETENVLIDESYCSSHPLAERGRYVLLSVTDTGSGMDEETLNHVFEPFFTTKGIGEGIGLGLSTVYGIIKQHNGMVNVYSEVGKGSTFKIYLPQVERSASSVGTKIEGQTPGGIETILLAEDDSGVRKLSKTILENAGYNVLTAVDGKEAKCIFDENADTIDMALLDVVMPNLGGRDVYEHIMKKRPQMRVLFASGYSMNAIHTNFVLDEGLQLIQKPYNAVTLLRRVREILDSTENDSGQSE